jgi:putative hemolysin
MDDWLLEILVLFALVLMNGFLSLAEFAIVQSRRTRLRQLADGGSRGATAALKLAETPDRFLSTVQIGITLVGILAGAFGGATLTSQLAGRLDAVPALAPYSNALALTVIVVLLSYITLVLGELAPKQLALGQPERFAIAVGRPMQSFARLAGPFARLLSASTRAVLWLLRVEPVREPAVTEDIVRNVFRLGDQRVGNLMIPRGEMVWLDVNGDPAVIRELVSRTGHTHYPVCDGKLENVLGLVSLKDLFTGFVTPASAGGAVDLRKLLTPPVYAPENMAALRLLEQFRTFGPRHALVVDEYGCVQGLVTLNDVHKAIAGALPESAPEKEPGFVRREDGSWLADGLVPIPVLKERFRLAKLPGEEKGGFTTLGGFVMARLGHIPRAAEYFDCGGWRFEVMDMDGNRVDKVLVRPAPGAAAEPAPPGRAES